MTTVIRPELSKKNRYYISKHRYYELKHFCLQYPEWKKEYLYSIKSSTNHLIVINDNTLSDPTSQSVERGLYFKERMDLVENAAKMTDSSISDYILKSVTQGLSYTTLSTLLNIPCSKGYFYERYRKFFWLLNETRK